MHASPGGPDLPGTRFEVAGIDVDEPDGRAELGQPGSHGESQAPSGAGDENGLLGDLWNDCHVREPRTGRR